MGDVNDDDDVPALEVADAPERPSDDPDGAEVAQGVKQLELNKPQDPYRLNLGHQEMERVLDELEGNCEIVLESAGRDAWMPIDGLEQLILKELGYEDQGEFEDALGGTFVQFVDALPHFETKVQDDGSSCDGQLVLRMVPPPSVARSLTMTLRVTKSEDLWRTLYKAPDAVIRIPSMEFEIGASEKRQLDAVFNHVTTAMFNLTQHARVGGMSSDNKEKVLECVEQLSAMLDIPQPWDLVVFDPSGRSVFKPSDGVSMVWEGDNDVAETA